jgi:hypothetical protein
MSSSGQAVKERALKVVPDANPGKPGVSNVSNRSAVWIFDQFLAHCIIPVELVGKARIGVANESGKTIC